MAQLVHHVLALYTFEVPPTIRRFQCVKDVLKMNNSGTESEMWRWPP